MQTVFDIYHNSADNSCRFALGIVGKKPLFVLGVNPSTADKEKSDITISKVRRFQKSHDCDSFIMLNLYPQRATNPKDIHAEVDTVIHEQNLQVISHYLQKVERPLVLAAWGILIRTRPFLKHCLTDIIRETTKYNCTWFQIGLTKGGHPKHPSRAAYCELTMFNNLEYLQGLT